MEIGPGIFFARTLDKNFFKEKANETGTNTFKHNSSADQGLGWLPDRHAGNDDTTGQEVQLMKKKIFPIAIFFLFTVTGPVMAEDSPTAGYAVPIMDEVVVTGSRFEDKLSSVPANITVIHRQDIENSTAENIPDLLRTQVGVQVTDIAGNRRKFRVDMRGFGETSQSNTLVLVDGRRINQADLSGTDWALISLENVERIELIRGGRGSVLYGDNASGGVVNIITKTGIDTQIGGRLAAGSYDTFKGALFYGTTSEKFSLSLIGNYTTSRGYRDNSDAESNDIALSLNYFPGDNFKINLRGGFHKDDTNLPGALKASDFASGVKRTATLQPNDFADTDDYYISAGPEIYFLNDSSFKFDISFRQRNFFSVALFAGGSFEGDTEINTLTFSPQLIIREKIWGLKNNLTLGVDYSDSEEDIDNKSVFFGFPSEGFFDLQKTNIGYYLQDDLILSDKVSLSAGFRHDRADFKFSPSTPDKVDFDENLFTVGLNYSLSDDIQVYGSYSQSFRYPLLDEVFSFFTNTVSTTLIPQTSDDYEIGLRYNLNNTFYANINLFRIETDEEIFLNPNTFNNENLDGMSRRDGVEFSLAWTHERLTLRSGYTYTEATLEDGTFAGNDVPGVPQHKVDLEASYQFTGGFSAALTGTYVGERPFESDFSNAFTEQDDYLLVNAKFIYRKDRFSVFLNLNNLTDEEYSEYGVLGGFPVEQAFYPSPEFNVLGGVSYKF
jgi:iron complex outermembrane receptor protein